MKEFKEIAIWCFYGMLAWSSAIATVGVSQISITQLNVLVPMIMAVYVWAIHYYRKNCGKREIRFGCLFSIPFALSLVLGSNVNMENAQRTFTWNLPLNFLYFCLLAVMGMVVVASLLVVLEKVSLSYAKVKYTPRTVAISAFILCLIGWLPYYLTYYPGIISNDAIWMIEQSIGVEPLSNHHPLLFTLFMKLILAIGTTFLSLNGAVGLFCIVHMILFAGVLGYIIYWLTAHKASRELLVITALYFACNPAIALYSVYLTKDIFFSCLVVIFILQLYDIMKNRVSVSNGSQVAKMLLLAMGLIFLRNNGLFIVVGSLLVLVVLYRSQWKALLFIGVMCIGGSGLVKGPIFAMAQIAPTSFAESMSIPLQQIGQVIVEDGRMNEEQVSYLSRILPFEQVKEVYRPGYVDPYKFHENFATSVLDETKREFLSVWIGMLWNNLEVYIESYLMQTVGYWHIGQTDSLSTYGVIENEMGIEQVNFIEKITGISLESLMEQLILLVRKAPVICYVTNMAAMMFGILLLSIFLCYRRRGRIALTLLPIWFLWGSLLLAAPAYCKFRYLFALALVLPYLAYVLQDTLYEGIVENEK